jgi:uncharacterized membrane protein YidH (DUF202 family)
MSKPRKEQERASLGQVITGILAAFFGVRRRAKHDEGMRKATPAQVIIVGLILAGGFALTLALVVWLVLRFASA